MIFDAASKRVISEDFLQLKRFFACRNNKAQLLHFLLHMTKVSLGTKNKKKEC